MNKRRAPQVYDLVLALAVDAVAHGTIDWNHPTHPMATRPGRRAVFDILAGIATTRDSDMAGEALTPSMAETPRRVWIIVLEEGLTGRREVVKVVLVGGNEENPVWERIRADASVPVQARQPLGRTRHTRIRKRLR